MSIDPSQPGADGGQMYWHMPESYVLCVHALVFAGLWCLYKNRRAQTYVKHYLETTPLNFERAPLNLKGTPFEAVTRHSVHSVSTFVVWWVQLV